MKGISKQDIIDTAARLINEKGTIEISLTLIAKELGITHAALYKHFNSKQAIWEAVASDWFEKQIIQQVQITVPVVREATPAKQRQRLHDWLWAFVNAKKAAYQIDSQMFVLNTEYVDNNPLVLRQVLTSAYKAIDLIMDYHDKDDVKAETIMATFATFMLPNFREAWSWPDYQARFEAIWQLLDPGLH